MSVDRVWEMCAETAESMWDESWKAGQEGGAK